MPSSRKQRGRLNGGDQVRIAAHVGAKGDGPSAELHGEPGIVVGSNPRYKNAGGETHVSVLLENGALVCVPERALKRG